MQKVSQKKPSFYPRNRKAFREALRQWTEKDYSVALDQAFNSKRDSTIRSKKFIDWFKTTIKRTYGTLEDVFIKHGIQPGEILDILAMHRLNVHLYPPKLQSKIRSLKLREKDAEILERAAEILNEWEAILPSLYLEAPEDRNEDYQLSEEVRGSAREIREVGPAVTHRPREIEQIRCAKFLMATFQQRLGRPCYRYVGELISATFWEKEGPYKFEELGKRLATANLTEKELEKKTPLVKV